jgi:hypothetical protein
MITVPVPIGERSYEVRIGVVAPEETAAAIAGALQRPTGVAVLMDGQLGRLARSRRLSALGSGSAGAASESALGRFAFGFARSVCFAACGCFARGLARTEEGVDLLDRVSRRWLSLGAHQGDRDELVPHLSDRQHVSVLSRHRPDQP